MEALTTKLIVLVSLTKAILYEAKGLKIIPKARYMALKIYKHIGSEKKDGFFGKRSLQSGFFDPHTAPQDITYKEAAQQIAHKIETEAPKYNELIIIANPKLIGHIKQSLKQHTLKLCRCIPKDIANYHNVDHVSKLVF
jgi:protein required for attachment to host cells